MSELRLPDGRTTQLWTGGLASGPTVLVCHGTPDTRWIARTGERAALDAGVRLLAVNRPGYGRSSPAPSTIPSVADDAVTVLDAVGVDRVAVLGMSVGGVYAAALAARHPERVVALALVATPARVEPVSGPASHSATVEEAMELFRPEFAAYAAGIDVADSDNSAVASRFVSQLPEPDAALLAEQPVAHLAAAAREALAVHDGYLRDAALLFRDWEFRPDAIRVPTHLWYGADDARNPPAAGAWWAERVDGARLVIRPRTTHLATLVAHWPDVLATLRGYLD